MRQVQTLEVESHAVPTSYVGDLADGERVYIRYRHGRLTVEVYPDEQSFEQAELIFEKTIGDEWAGIIMLDEVVGQTADVLRFPAELVETVTARQRSFHEENDEAWENFFASVADKLED